ncbi:HutD/Ves family protein [Marinifilum breve]|uniref:HutD/Ves family protein n=1 Tax=Marinifilum breve TaxID=2184082 RepID=UPI0014036064|nr:HutD family protein [Marinifilum breve]
MNNYRIKKEHHTSKWAGGETTELYIYPEDTQYKKGDFLFRISSATVEIEESAFTPLPGVDRILMVLDGQMKLEHENHHTKLLADLDSDHFSGEWTTLSKGKCTDFNLMCKSGSKGNVKGFNLIENAEQQIDMDGKINFIFLYKGSIEINGHRLSDGDMLIVDSPSLNNTITANQESKFVMVNIMHV